MFRTIWHNLLSPEETRQRHTNPIGSILGSGAVWLHGKLNPTDMQLKFGRLAAAVALLNEAVVEDDNVRKAQLVLRARLLASD